MFSERFSKGAFSRARQLYQRLDFNASDAPGLSQALTLLLSPPLQARLPREFLKTLSTGKRLLQAALQEVLVHVASTGVVVGTLDMRSAYTAHCIWVGTTAVLIKLGLSEPAIKAWVGWCPSSQVWADYARNPTFFPWEVTFAR